MAQLQDLILRLKSKHVLTARCLMSLIGLLASTEKMVPEGRLHIRPFSVSPQGALEISSIIGQPPPLDRCHFCTGSRTLQKWWEVQTFIPRPQFPTLYRHLKRKLGRSFRSSSTKGLWSNQEKRLHINVLEFKAVSLALQNSKDQFQNQTVLVATATQQG